MKKNLWIIIILLIINLIILGSLLFYIFSKNKDNKSDSMITTPGEIASFELNDKIYPENYMVFEKFIKNSKINKSDVYSAIYSIVKNLPEIYDNQKNINQYYSKKLNVINKQMKINNVDDYKSLVENLKKKYSKDTKYVTVKFLTESFRGTNGINCEFVVVLDNKKELKFKFVADSYNTTSFKIIPIAEE